MHHAEFLLHTVKEKKNHSYSRNLQMIGSLSPVTRAVWRFGLVLECEREGRREGGREGREGGEEGGREGGREGGMGGKDNAKDKWTTHLTQKHFFAVTVEKSTSTNTFGRLPSCSNCQ